MGKLGKNSEKDVKTRKKLGKRREKLGKNSKKQENATRLANLEPLRASRFARWDSENSQNIPPF